MDDYLGAIRIFTFGYVPRNYKICDGSRLTKLKYNILHKVIGDIFTYDTTDDATFAIPDLRDRFVKHSGTAINLGEKKGRNEVTLSMEQMPEHNHKTKIDVDNSNGGDEITNQPKNAYINNKAGVFSKDPSENTFLGGISQENVGNSEPLNIKNAHVKMVYAMCIRGIYPNGGIDNEGFLGEIRLWASDKMIPNGWALCNGDTYSIGANSAFASIIGSKYGQTSSGKPKLPDFRNRFATGASKFNEVGENGGNTNIRLGLNQLPQHNHKVQLAVNNDNISTEVQIPNDAFINKNTGPFSAEINIPATLGKVYQENRGGSEEIDITNKSLGLFYIISKTGSYNPNSENSYLGEIKMYAGYKTTTALDRSGLNYCHGQIISISTNNSLFSLIGTSYGGNGRVTFALPNLKNSIPLCISNFNEIGKQSGTNSIKLKTENLPEHDHNVQLAANHTGDGRLVNIPNGVLNKDAGPFSTKETASDYLGGVEEINFKGEKTDIQNPYLTINYLICFDGIYPSRS